MDRLSISHTILYAKDWYEQRDLFSDMQKVLTADGHYVESISDCLYVLLNALDKWNPRFITPSNLVASCNPGNTWKYGYLTKKSQTPMKTKTQVKYDYFTAVLLYILSKLRYLDKDQFVFTEPDKNILPLKKQQLYAEQ